MSNTTHLLDEALKKHDAHRSRSRLTRASVTDEFLKEAYRIEASVSSLYSYLRSIRQSYLTTSTTRRNPLHRVNSTTTTSSSSDPSPTSPQDRKHLTNRQKDQIDTDAKTALRDANASIRQLADAELLRQRTEQRVTQEKKARNAGFRALSKWAAGGGGSTGQEPRRSPEEQLQDAIRNTAKAHREAVIWFLDWKLGEVARVQREMMETRLEREVEKSKSALYKTRRGFAGLASEDIVMDLDDNNANGSAPPPSSTYAQLKAAKVAVAEDAERQRMLEGIGPEQLQVFEQENSEMLRRLEETLDQVRTAERSIHEIAELHSTLTANLNVQSENISLLVADAQRTDENLRGGNQELTKATERKSTARMVFFASCGLSAFLVVWDLVF